MLLLVILTSLTLVGGFVVADIFLHPEDKIIDWMLGLLNKDENKTSRQ